MEKFLGKFEAIYPRKPIGVMKGIPVFRRSMVHSLNTAYGWRKLGRSLIPDDKDTPYKVVEGKATSASSSSNEVVQKRTMVCFIYFNVLKMEYNA